MQKNVYEHKKPTPLPPPAAAVPRGVSPSAAKLAEPAAAQQVAAAKYTGNYGNKHAPTINPAAPGGSFALGLSSNVRVVGSNYVDMYNKKRHASSQKFTNGFSYDHFVL